LGITLDENLKWKKQIDIVSKRIRKLTYIFLEVRNYLSTKQLYSIYYGLVQSLLQYSITSWGAAYSTSLNCIEIAQKLIIKIIIKKPRDYSSERLFRDFRVLKFKDLFRLGSILQVLKEPGYHTFITTNRTRCEYAYRQAKGNTTFAQHHYNYIGEKNFNELPLNIRKQKVTGVGTCNQSLYKGKIYHTE
jgi:uncharacterized protein YjaZ